MAHNGSPWYANPAPSGAQAAFVQSILAGGDAASTFSGGFFEPGEYQVRFSVVRRDSDTRGPIYSGEDGQGDAGTVPSSSQPDDVWRTLHGALRVYTESGRHTLSLCGDPGGGDFSSAVDDVQIHGSTQFQVRFCAPSGPGFRTATLSIESNDPDEFPYELTLTGTGCSFRRFRLHGSGHSCWK